MVLPVPQPPEAGSTRRRVRAVSLIAGSPSFFPLRTCGRHTTLHHFRCNGTIGSRPKDSIDYDYPLSGGPHRLKELGSALSRAKNKDQSQGVSRGSAFYFERHEPLLWETCLNGDRDATANTRRQRHHVD